MRLHAGPRDHALADHPGAVVTEYSWDAGSCDPCPGPTLDGNDLQTFGADVIGSKYKDAGAYTLTRLHARYGKDVKNDLVFRAVEPIAVGAASPTSTARCPTRSRTRATTTSRAAT